MQTFFKMNTALVHVPSGVIRTKVTAGTLGWLRGLIGMPRLGADEGLLLRRARRLHTFGIQYAVDCIFLSIDNQIIHIVENVAAGKLIAFPKAAHILVLAAGQAQALDLQLKLILILHKSDD